MQEEKNNPSISNLKKNFKSKALPIILGTTGLIIVLLVIGGGALLAGHVWNPKWNPFKQNPNSDKVIREKTRSLIGK